MNPERRRSWMILATAFITLTVVSGVWYSYSVFLVILVRELGWSRSLVSGAFAVFGLIHGAIGPPVGWLLGRIGLRRVILAGVGVMAIGLILTAQTTAWWHLYLAFGVITGVGISLNGWVPVVVLIRGWFPDRMGSAMGIASGGIGLGIFGFVPLTQVLIDWCGWRWTFGILAAVTVAWGLPSVFWMIQEPPGSSASASSPERSELPGSRPPRPRAGDRARAWDSPRSGGLDPSEVGEVYWTIGAAARCWRFWGLAGVFFTGNFVTQMLLVHQVVYLVDHGMPALSAATVGGVVGLVSIATKLGWGVFSDRAGREVAYTLAAGCTVAGIGLLVLAGRYPASSLPYVYAMLTAFGYGVLSPVFPAVASDLFRGPGFSTIYGTLYTVMAIGLAAGPWAAAQIFDLTGSYTAALWLGSAMAVLSPGLLWIVAPRRPNPPPAAR
jgi:MFS family permease